MANSLTPEDIEAICRDLAEEPHFKARNDEWSANRALVFRERPVVFPGVEMETEYRTPDLLDAADKYTARFLSASFTVNVAAQAPGPKAEQKAQAMENYDYRLLSRWWSSGVFHGPIHDMAGVTGEGWVHLTLNRDVLPIIPQGEDGEDDEAYLKRARDVLDEFTTGERADLFQIEPINEPETIYYTKDRSIIFSRMEVPLAPLQQQYAQDGAGGLYGERGKGKAITVNNGLYEVTTLEGAIDPAGLNAGLYNGTVTLYVVETADYIYHLIEDTASSQGRAQGRYANKYRQMHRLGCYKNIFGAPAFVSVQARKTNHPSAKHAVHPLTHGAIAIAPQHNIMSTIVYSAGIYGEMTRIMLKPAPGPEAAAERANNKNLEIELIGNRVIKVPDGWEPFQPNIGVNADTLNAHQALEAKMVQNGYPPALGEPQSVDATSGYQQAVMRDTVANVLDPPLANIAAMLNQLLRLKDTGIKTLGIPVTFRNFAPTDEMGKVARAVMDEIAIEPDDIVEVDRSVTFDSLTQYARQARIELGRALLADGRITEDMFLREYAGIDDPARLKRQRLVEKAQMLAEEFALKSAGALFQRVVEDVAAEATVQSGIAPFVARADPMSGAYTSNGAGGQVPLEPTPPAEPEMGAMSGGATSY